MYLSSFLHQMRVTILNPHECGVTSHQQNWLHDVIGETPHLLDVVNILFKHLDALTV